MVNDYRKFTQENGSFSPDNLMTKEITQSPVTVLTTSVGGQDAKPSMRPDNPVSGPIMIDVRSLIDDEGCASKQRQSFSRNCDPTNYVDTMCKALSTNVPSSLVTRGIVNTIPDFQQGARSRKRVSELAHLLALGSPLPYVFQAVDISVAPAVGRDWMVGAWSLDPGFWLMGVQLVFTRKILDSPETELLISNDPLKAGGYPGGNLPVPPSRIFTPDTLIRGKGGSSLMFEQQAPTAAVTLPTLYRAQVNMDTALFDIGRAIPINTSTYTYFTQMRPAAPAASIVYAVSYMVSSTVPLDGIRCSPITSNNRDAAYRVVDLSAGGV